MRAANQWLDWLSVAKVPAFLCRHDGDRVVLVAATPEFTDALMPGDEALTETDLLAQVASEWPRRDAGPVVMHIAGAPNLHCVLQSLGHPSGECLGILQATEDHQRHNDSFYDIVQQLPDIVARFDRDHRHLFVNRAMQRIVGIDPQVFFGKTNAELGMPDHLVEVWKSLHSRVFETGEPAELEFEFETEQGPKHFLCRVVPEYAADGTIPTILSTSHDITQLKSLQRQLALLASTDPLTSLLNRRGFAEVLEAEAGQARSSHVQLSLLLIDVNDFKVVNDTFGHLAGDDLLVTIGEVLRREVRDSDFVGRLGGDEFCVGIVDSDGARARDTADRIRQRISTLGAQGLSPCDVSVSIGLATYADTDRNVADLIARVDQAMYREKSRRTDAR